MFNMCSVGLFLNGKYCLLNASMWVMVAKRWGFPSSESRGKKLWGEKSDRDQYLLFERRLS